MTCSLNLMTPLGKSDIVEVSVSNTLNSPEVFLPSLLLESVHKFDKTLKYVSFQINSHGNEDKDSKQTSQQVNVLELLMSQPKAVKQPQLIPAEKARFTGINYCLP